MSTLPSPDEHEIMMPDGTLVVDDTMSEREIKEFSLRNPRAAGIEPKRMLTVEDLPGVESEQVFLGLVLYFSCIGLTDSEMLHLFKNDVTIEDINRIRNSQHYQEHFDILFNNLINHNSSSLQARIAAFAPNAMTSMMNLTQQADKDMVRYRASEYMLDAAGAVANKMFGQSEDQEDGGGLTIVVNNVGEEGSTNDIHINVKR